MLEDGRHRGRRHHEGAETGNFHQVLGPMRGWVHAELQVNPVKAGHGRRANAWARMRGERRVLHALRCRLAARVTWSAPMKPLGARVIERSSSHAPGRREFE